MSKRSLSVLAVLLFFSVFPAGAATPDAFGKLPLTFETNVGQVAPEVRFLSRTPRYTMFLTPSEAVLSLQGGENDRAVVRWRMVGANADPRIVGESPVETRTNYFRGNDPKNWRTDVANFGQVRYQGVYPGIDVVYRGNERQVEYDFVIAPKANPKQIRIAFDGAQSMKLGKNGELILRTAQGDLVQPKPYVYQDINGRRQAVDGRYALRGKEVSFVLGRFDRNHALVIDPVLVWSTYLGGTLEDYSWGLTADSSGNTYVVGISGSPEYPTVNPVQATKAYDWDVVVTKINAAGTAIVYSTFLGGNGWNEYGLGIAVDSSSNIYVVGGTNATDFPGVTAGSIQPTLGSTGSYGDAYALKLNAAGNTILWSTYLGGSGWELAYGIAADSSGNAYVGGFTDSSNIPSMSGSAIQATHAGGGNDGFVIKIDTTGAKVWSTYLGGSGGDGVQKLRLDGSGNTWVAGGTSSSSFPGVNGSSLQSTYAGNGDGYLTKINAAGNAISYSTYHGGSGEDGIDGLAIDGSGNIYVSGDTTSTTFPGVTGSSVQSTLAGSNDIFVSKMNSTATSITWSTFLGGSDVDVSSGVGVDGSGNAYVAGSTLSTDFPVSNAIQSTYGGAIDAVVAKINAAGTALDWSTYLGGSSEDQSFDIAVDGSSNVHLSGFTDSTGFPGTSGSAIDSSYNGGYDIWVTKISNTASPSLTSINPTSGVPGTQVTLTGTGFGAVRGTGSVWLGNKLAGSIVSWSDTQIVATVATNVATGSASVQQAGTWSNSLTFTIITPTISSVSPSSGVPGTQVTITGTNFGATQGSGTVWLGSTYAGSIVSWSNTQIVATVAANSISGTVQVQQSGVWGNQVAFTVTSPSITGISPSTARAGDQITITGTNFGATQGSGSVWLGNKLAGSIVSWSNTQIVATVASGALSGNAQVRQNGVWGNQVPITIITPDVTSVSPTTARAGDSVTITGTGFGATQGSGSVWLGSKLAGSIVSWSDTQIVATVASGSVTGTAQVQQGGVWDNYGTFTVITPVLSSISPTSGPVGTQVTFTGTGFGTTQGSGKVWLANKYATIVSWSDTQIVATVVAGSSTSASQVLQGGVWSNTITFTVTP